MSRSLLALAMLLWTAGNGVASPPAAPNPKPVLELAWGRGAAEVGFLNARSGGREETGPMGPQSFLPLPGGGLVLADTWNDRLLVFDAAGKLTRTLADAVLKMPWLLARGAGGDLYVALGRGQHVVRLNSSFQVKAAFGGRGEGPAKFSQLVTMAVDSQGNLACADLMRNSIELVDATGRHLAALPWQGTGMCLASDDTIMDLDYEKGRGYTVRGRRADGSARYVFAIPGDGLEGGKILGIDSKHRVVVRFTRSDTPGWKYLARFDSTGKTIEDLGKIPHLPADGQVYVCDDGALMWLDYDAEAAPAGKMRLYRK